MRLLYVLIALGRGSSWQHGEDKGKKRHPAKQQEPGTKTGVPHSANHGRKKWNSINCTNKIADRSGVKALEQSGI